MEAIQSQSKQFSLKQILKDNWCAFLDVHHSLVTWYAAYNVWKVINCREPDGLGYATYACPIHSSETQNVPHSCKSRFCSICAKVQIDKWVTNMNHLFPNCSYFHITFTVPSQFRTLLFEKRTLLNAVFAASTETLISFCKEQGLLPAITAVLHTFGRDLKRHVHIHCIILMSSGTMAFWQVEWKPNSKKLQIDCFQHHLPLKRLKIGEKDKPSFKKRIHYFARFAKRLWSLSQPTVPIAWVQLKDPSKHFWPDLCIWVCHGIIASFV